MTGVACVRCWLPPLRLVRALVCKGYGLTETCSAGTLQPFDCCEDGVAGSPVRCLELRLADCDQKVRETVLGPRA